MMLLHVDASGRQVEILADDAAMPQQGFVWMDVLREDPGRWLETAQRLADLVIDEKHVQDSFNPAHPSYYEETSGYDLVVFRSLAPESGQGALETRASAFLVSDRLLVSVRSADSRSVQEIHRRLQAGSKLPAHPEMLLYLVLGNMVDRFLGLRRELGAAMEDWRHVLLRRGESFDEWAAFLAQRSQLHGLEMLSEEQEDAISQWKQRLRNESDPRLLVRLNDLVDHIRRVGKFAVAQQHELESLVQLHYAVLADRTNRIVRVLTVLSAIFMPLTLIAGIFGMNFEGMPGIKQAWGFYMTLGGMALTAVLLLLVFRRKRWF